MRRELQSLSVKATATLLYSCKVNTRAHVMYRYVTQKAVRKHAKEAAQAGKASS